MKSLTEEEARIAGQSADDLIIEISVVLDRWECANEDKSEHYKACVLIGAVVSLLWGMCMHYKVPVTQVLDHMAESYKEWEEGKDELH